MDSFGGLGFVSLVYLVTGPVMGLEVLEGFSLRRNSCF